LFFLLLLLFLTFSFRLWPVQIKEAVGSGQCGFSLTSLLVEKGLKQRKGGVWGVARWLVELDEAIAHGESETRKEAATAAVSPLLDRSNVKCRKEGGIQKGGKVREFFFFSSSSCGEGTK
jgi:hypothetical protein